MIILRQLKWLLSGLAVILFSFAAVVVLIFLLENHPVALAAISLSVLVPCCGYVLGRGLWGGE